MAILSIPDENGRLVDVDEPSLEGIDETLGGLVRAGDGRRPVKADKGARTGDLLVDDHLKSNEKLNKLSVKLFPCKPIPSLYRFP